MPQSEILAVTFTNKAAREMAQRVKELVPRKLARLTVCTFHAFGAQVLREHGGLLGYRRTSASTTPRTRPALLKETARELGHEDRDRRPAGGRAGSSPSVKTGGPRGSTETEHLKPLFKEYQKNLKLYNAVDFDDLIMLPLELLSKHPEVRQAYHERYRYLLVDEFQDTSAAQYELMRLLVGPEATSAWSATTTSPSTPGAARATRTSCASSGTSPGCSEITLEQNYRSTRDHPAGRQRADLAQHQPQGQEALDGPRRRGS